MEICRHSLLINSKHRDMAHTKGLHWPGDGLEQLVTGFALSQILPFQIARQFLLK
jgi:hypothetical protein